MDPELFKAAMEGNLEVLGQRRDQLEAQVTPNKNSVLHVAALFNKSNVVEEILTAKPLLLCKDNIKGDTALHIAAREGHFSIVQALIECAKEMANSELERGIGMAKKMLMRMTNKAGNTALHEAVWNKDHLNVVDLLVEEDPEFLHLPNNDEETPLYLAAERGFDDIVSKILYTCTSLVYSGPDGRTALHGAVISNSEGCTRQLLNWKQSLCKESDIYGWTPLHYAAVLGHLSRVSQLLNADKLVAYLTTDEDKKMTPLHLAATKGEVDIMKELISRCPDCWEMVDGEGQNILHLAARYLRFEVIDFILKDSRLNSLKNQKDDKGNTPLHLLASFGTEYNYLFRWHEECVINMTNDPRVDKKAFNKGKLTPLDIAIEKNPTKVPGIVKKNLLKVGVRIGGRNLIKLMNDMQEKWRNAQEESSSKPTPKDIDKTSDSYLIVSAFIATVTFAAGITIPGGYDGNEGPNQGMAVLTRAAAFKTFVISDTIAMVLSIGSVCLHFLATFYKKQDKIINRSATANNLVILSGVAMIVAFMTGMYAMLAQSLALAISVCLIVSFSCLLFFVLIRKKLLHGDGVDVMRVLIYLCCSPIARLARLFSFGFHWKLR